MHDRSHLLTEQRLPESMNLDTMPIGEAVALMNRRALAGESFLLVWLGFAAILALASLLFYRMIKAMARIQMPERRPPSY